MPAALPIAIGASAAGGVASSIMGANAAGSAADKQAAASQYATDIQKQEYDQQRADLQPWRQAGINSLYGAGGLFTRKDGGTGMAMTADRKNKWIDDRAHALQAQGYADIAQKYGDSKMFNDQRDALRRQVDGQVQGLAQADWEKTGSKDPAYQAQIDASQYQIDPSLTRGFTADDFQKDPGYDFRMQQGQQALERSAAARGGLQSGGTLKAIGRYGQDYASNEYNNAYNRFTNDQSNRFNRLSSIAGLGQTANAQLGQAGQSYAGNVGNIATNNANAQGAAGIAKANAIGQGFGTLGNLASGATWMDLYDKRNGGKGLF